MKVMTNVVCILLLFAVLVKSQQLQIPAVLALTLPSSGRTRATQDPQI
jgi:hypothetical protein